MFSFRHFIYNKVWRNIWPQKKTLDENDNLILAYTTSFNDLTYVTNSLLVVKELLEQVTNLLSFMLQDDS